MAEKLGLQAWALLSHERQKTKVADMAGLFYSKITWSIAVVVMAVVFCFQLGLQYGHAHNAAAADRLENKLAQWDAKYHPDERAASSAIATDHQDAVR